MFVLSQLSVYFENWETLKHKTKRSMSREKIYELMKIHAKKLCNYFQRLLKTKQIESCKKP